jgi:hypothetical protein
VKPSERDGPARRARSVTASMKFGKFGSKIVFVTCGLALLIIFSVIFGENAMALSLDQIYGLLPSEFEGWKKAQEPVFYDRDTLYDYIDGGAELYIAYSFKKVLAVKYVKGQDSEIVIDFFDMGNSYDAFGIFSHSREEENEKLGQGAEYNSGLLTFWKDRYYVSILAYPETEEKKQIVLKLGRILADAISETGELPPIVSQLPRDNLIPESIRYFHHPVVLNSLYYVADENILHIDDHVQAALATYGVDDSTFYLLLCQYPDRQKAETAHQSFLTHYLPDAQEGVVKLSDGEWTGCRIKDNVLAIVFGSPSQKVLESYLRFFSGEVS